jgi:transposase
MIKLKNNATSFDLEDYHSMSKEQLIEELIKAKINEARAKKGYEVKGVGQNKEFISLNNKNSKS